MVGNLGMTAPAASPAGGPARAAGATEVVDLGPESSYTELPAAITVANRSYYLIRAANGEAVRNGTIARHDEGVGYRLVSTACPHQGGTVADAGDCFECPQHGWRFDRTSGQCLNVPNQRLSSFPVVVENGRLLCEMPAPAAPARTLPIELQHLDQLTLQLHAHACLEITYKGFSVLTDPWLCGPAFLGAWTHYPSLVVDVAKLHPDAIVISHEHSDHFHEPTLVRFDRSIPIYVPDFPNRRLVERLAALGFTNVRAMAFGETYSVSDHLRVTCFEPSSLWNDSIMLFEIDGFRILNINDAGLNQRIASLVAPVDVLASSFSPGASGYPLTWGHLTDERKTDILVRAGEGYLGMLKQATQLYGAAYMLPFASHFTLWHPDHRDYVRMLRKNTLDDVVRTFADTEVQVIDLLPGETWDVSQQQISRLWRSRERLYTLEHVLRHVERRFDERLFREQHPASGELTRGEIEAYFLRLNETPEVIFCEDLAVSVRATSDPPMADDPEIFFECRAGKIRILEETPGDVNLTIEAPMAILALIVKENLSWDEAHIGFWCRFSRSRDVYHAGFWRLLQAPYFKRPAEPPPGVNGAFTPDSVIAELIERHGDPAERILRRYGLYCAGCHRATYDSLALGARHHGLDASQVERLVRELNMLFHDWPGDTGPS